jgi:hypothetical protein
LPICTQSMKSMSSDLRRMAEELLTLSAIRNTIETEYRRRREALQEVYEELGLERQRIVTNADMEFGTVVLATETTVVDVCDRDAMMAWLEDKRPDMIITRRDIDPSYWKLLTDTARSCGIGADPATGEYLPWIRVTPGNRNLRATPTREAKEAVRETIKNSGIKFALEAGAD